MGSDYFHRGHTESRIEGEKNPEHSLGKTGKCFILGRVTLFDWEEMWASLRQEEIRRLSKVGSNDKGIRIKKEEEVDASLTLEGN